MKSKNKTSFMQTALTLLEDHLDAHVERRFKQTSVVNLSKAEVITAIVNNSERITKKELLELMLQDVSSEILEAYAAGLRASNDLPAVAYQESIVITEFKDAEDLFDGDIIAHKIYSSVKRRGVAVLSEIVKDVKEFEMIVVKKIELLIDEGLISSELSNNTMFDTKKYFCYN